MSKKALKILIVMLAIATLINCGLIFYLDKYVTTPQSDYDITILGAVFKEPSETGIIDVYLVRPPRQAVFPGDTTEPGMSFQNTGLCNVKFRGLYQIVIRDSNDNLIDNFTENIKIETNNGWYYDNGYWYYPDSIKPSDAAPGLIKSITYGEAFSDHVDYKVYIHLLTECTEEINGNLGKWPNVDAATVAKAQIDERVTWTNKIVIQ